MEIKEKLELFHEAVLQTAGAKSGALLEEYKKNYEESLKEYESRKQKEQSAREKMAEEKIRKEMNRNVSREALIQKRQYHEQAELKKEYLFAKVEKMLAEYRETEEYKEKLKRQIQKAKAFAKEEAVTIYLNVSDKHWKEQLEQETGCTLTISEIDFMGGIRAVIRTKNILIDESFSARFAEEKENYSF